MKTTAIALLLAIGTLIPSDAPACGGFFARRGPAMKRVPVPSLQVENVLIVHDKASETEHFVREIVFRGASEPFGFVVPTPSQPTVHEVAKSPFAALDRYFPHETRQRSRGLGSGRGAAPGGGGAPKPAVTVLSQERIGSFTAFVLAANDASALRKWLEDNQLATTKESEAWLDHYVKLGFFFTAFRYEISSGNSDTKQSQTVRLTFKTPLPYYPYKEPEHPQEEAKSAEARMLSVWFVGTEERVPVAAAQGGEGASWKRPWAEHNQHLVQDGALRDALGDLYALLPPPPKPQLAPDASDAELLGTFGPFGRSRWNVQTFEDQKRDRGGFGDVVLVPKSPEALDPKREDVRKLMASLALEGSR